MSEFTKRCVHSRNIHNTPNWVSEKCPSIIKWINQPRYVPQTEILHSNKNKYISKRGKVVAEAKKSDMKEFILYESICTQF